VALVYPNTERVALANLGLHAVYRLLDAAPGVACELGFLPEDAGPPRAQPSGTPLGDFDVLAFSVSFEHDLGHLVALLDRAGLPLRAAARDGAHPLVIAGGIAPTINPEPLAPFVDAILVGEAEALLPDFLAALDAADAAGLDRPALLDALARVPGCYVPSRYEVEYADTRDAGGRWVLRRTPLGGAPDRVARRWVADLSRVATSRVLDSPEAQFGDLHLTELARGCLWGCRFCAAGFVQRPYREVSLETLRGEAAVGLARGMKLGLVGPDVSDHSGLHALAACVVDAGGGFSPSSLRVDAITPALAAGLAASGERSITLAPEAGTARLRRVLNKDFDDDRIVQAAADALAAGLQHVKLYFMYGLPTETDEDIDGMAALTLRLRQEVLLPRARATGKMGHLTLSVNPFIPKPWTPFQWWPIEAEPVLKARRRRLERALKPHGVVLDVLSTREATLQAVLSRGDRRVADLLELAHREHGGDLRAALRGWPHDPDYFAARHIGVDEDLPWDVLDQGLEKRYLARELERGLGAKVTPPCHVAQCRACGLDCADHPELVPLVELGGGP
jgi:radical SAM superfamily enzyme YgiQ (UPF0313 family)